MAIKFDETAYYQSFTSEYKFDKNKLKNDQRFSYDKSNKVKVSNYSEHYKDTGWMGRKVVALPAAAWSGIVKVTYHLAKAIIFSLFSDKPGTYFKVQIYSAIRDLEEAFGHILTIFNDKHGLYHIEQASFHKSCYECFLISDLEIEVNQEAQQACENIRNLMDKGERDLADHVREMEQKKIETNTKALNKFKEIVENNLSKIKELLSNDKACENSPEILNRVIESQKTNIKWHIKMNSIMGEEQERYGYKLTNDQINTVLDEFIATWTGDEYSFLEDLKV